MGGAIDCRLSSFSKKAAAWLLNIDKGAGFRLFIHNEDSTVVLNIKEEARVTQKNGVNLMLSRHADSLL